MGLLRRKPGEPFNPVQVRSPIANIGQVVHWLQQLHEEQKRTNELLEQLVAQGQTPPNPYAPAPVLMDRGRNERSPDVPDGPDAPNPYAPNVRARNPYIPDPPRTRNPYIPEHMRDDRDEPEREPRGV